ncbi:carboxypeptidase-like regulatory domain-containing protein [Thermogemmatispora tikiterensis]|uniref:carboxypeptidase-like regulatory domain-containing protein n=1 Tax=Thermogemmatispora tikiterensis TaxID=1825093 RepID=UPI0011BF83AD|nr:carboxypeptidase-like regulatory domain-containing protein [Thermogemmatispora tikiterensis]
MSEEATVSSGGPAGGRLILTVTIPLLSLLALLWLLIPVAPTQAASSASTGTIRGHLVNGTHNNAPVAGQSVTLQMAQDGSARDLTTLKTDSQGAFLFTGLATASTVKYAVYTRYQGAQYVSDLVDLSKQAVQQIELIVYDATSSSADLAVVQATILIHEPDASKGTFTVSEIYFFQNVGKTTYVGSLNASQGRPNALLFSLPQGARNVALDQGFNSVEAIQVAGGFASDAAVPPGETQFSFSFEVPYQSTSYDFAYTFFYPTVQLSVLTPPALQASSGALSSKGLMTANSHPYLLLQNQNFRSGDQVHVRLQGLPLSSSQSQHQGLFLVPTWVWLVGGVLVMLAIIVLSSLLYHLFQRWRESKPRGHPHAQKRPAHTHAELEATRTRDKADAGSGEQDRLLHQLLELDKAFEEGRLKKTEYTEERARIKERLRVLLSLEQEKEHRRGAKERPTAGSSRSSSNAKRRSGKS